MSNAPIGVFDSGLGGLTVVRELRRRLPYERIVYFGDIARLPYGIKSEKQIRDFSRENTEFLLHRNIKALVVACNSSSSAAFSFLKARYHLPIIDVICPAAQTAVRVTRSGRIGVMATQATIHSRAYERAIKAIDGHIKIFSKACPLLVPFVEEGILNGKLVEMALARYLGPLKGNRIDTLILGCTHYPMLRQPIQKIVGKRVRLIDSAPAAVRTLKETLEDRGEISNIGKRGKLEVFVSDFPNNFTAVGSRFLGEELAHIKVVRFKYEITKNGKWTL
jgi:glutamate racemase